MTGSDFYAYVLRTFIRTDKSTQAYEAITDTVQDMRRRIPIDDQEIERTSTDTIVSLGDYKITLEADQGLEVAEMRVIDGTASRPLKKLSKAQYDELYPNQSASSVQKSKPVHYCVFGGEALLGPVPDKVSYTYKFSFSKDDQAAITSITAAVPFTAKYREILKFGTLARLFNDLDNEQASKYGKLYEDYMGPIEDKQRNEKGAITIVKYQGI